MFLKNKALKLMDSELSGVLPGSLDGKTGKCVKKECERSVTVSAMNEEITLR